MDETDGVQAAWRKALDALVMERAEGKISIDEYRRRVEELHAAREQASA